jgi:transposase
MPTVPRRPAVQQERDWLQARRLRAAELFTIGVRQAEVARQLGVSRQAVSLWHARWKQGGTQALHSRGPTGPTPKICDARLGQVEQALLKGAGANGFVGELWTLDRIAIVIERLTGVRHHPAWVWALLRYRLGWSVQRPVRRAAERDQDSIDRWVKERWPAIKQTPNDAEPNGSYRVGLGADSGPVAPVGEHSRSQDAVGVLLTDRALAGGRES